MGRDIRYSAVLKRRVFQNCIRDVQFNPFKTAGRAFGFVTPQNPESTGESMLNHKLRNITYVVVVGALLIVSGHVMFAQNQSSQEKASTQEKVAQKKASDEKKAATQEKAANLETSATEKAGGKKAKSSAESCDGALDIVPAKSMSFSRKRRPARTDSEIPVDAKPNKTPDQKDDVNPNKLRQNEEKS